ncbi:MAG: hypothetical protein WC736_14850 [Gallionella sp.]|jgi:hypothetical protein
MEATNETGKNPAGAQSSAEGATLSVRLAAKPLPDGVPCSHRGCLHHVTHPCEGCGRIAGVGVVDLYDTPDTELPGMWERADFM